MLLTSSFDSVILVTFKAVGPFPNSTSPPFDNIKYVISISNTFLTFDMQYFREKQENASLRSWNGTVPISTPIV